MLKQSNIQAHPVYLTKQWFHSGTPCTVSKLMLMFWDNLYGKTTNVNVLGHPAQ